MTKTSTPFAGCLAINSHVGNLPSLPGIFPDYPAPVVRDAVGKREIVMARWGMPSSPLALTESAKKPAAKLEIKDQVAPKQAIGFQANYPGFIPPALASRIERVPNGE